MLCHSKLRQSATNTVAVQYILQTACHDRNKPSPSIREKNNLVLFSHLHLCKLTMKCGGRGHEPSFFTLQASYQRLHRAQRCKVRAMSLKELREGQSPKPEWGLGISCCLVSSGSALGWSGSPTAAWSCPAVVPGAASAVALPWGHSRNHSLFVLQPLNTLKASEVLWF